LSFDDLVGIYKGFRYDFNGYVSTSGGDNGSVTPGIGLGCSGFASVILQRLQSREQWKGKYKSTLHQYLGATLRPDQRRLGGIVFTSKNVKNAIRVFPAGIGQRFGLATGPGDHCRGFTRRRA
jgi:hypothetical protein